MTMTKRQSIEHESSKFDDLMFTMNMSILPFLDTWTQHKLSTVNKTCHDAVRGCNDSGYLYDLFKSKQICMECMGVCKTSQTSDIGLYCHPKCHPAATMYDMSGREMPVSVHPMTVRPGMVTTSLYNAKHPFMTNMGLTLQHHTRRNFKVYHDLYMREVIETKRKRLWECMEHVSKKGDLAFSWRMHKTVRVGTAAVSVYNTFSKIHPFHMDDMTTDTIVTELGKLEVEMRQLHSEMKGHFAAHVRPKMYIKADNTWDAYLRVTCAIDSTFIDWVLKGGYLKDRGALTSLMSQHLEQYNKKTLNGYVESTVRGMVDVFNTTWSVSSSMNVLMGWRHTVRYFMDGSPAFVDIVNNATTPSEVFKTIVKYMTDKMTAFCTLFVEIYQHQIREESPWRVAMVTGGSMLNSMVLGLLEEHPSLPLTMDHKKFVARFNILSTQRFHPLYIFRELLLEEGPVDFYTETIEVDLEDAVMEGESQGECICDDRGLLIGDICQEHGTCEKCCRCTTTTI